jgi:hypothetical protein
MEETEVPLPRGRGEFDHESCRRLVLGEQRESQVPIYFVQAPPECVGEEPPTSTASNGQGDSDQSA